MAFIEQNISSQAGLRMQPESEANFNIQVPAQPIPICHVQVLSILSGVQRVMLEIFKHLDKTRYAPHVVCRDFGPLTDELQQLGIPFTTIPSLDRPIRPHRDYAALRELRKTFSRHNFQLVHTHSSKPGIVARLAARQVGVPHIVHHVHSFAFHEFTPRLHRFIYSRLEKWAGKFSEKVIFVNNEERRLAIRGGWLKESKCETVYNGVDLRRISSMNAAEYRKTFRESNGISEDEIVVMTLGRLEEPKQPLIFPKIAAHLESICPDRRWRFVVAGSGSYERVLRDEIQKHAMGHRFKIAGWQNDSLRALTAADVLLQPSLWEGLPVSVIEAHAVGIPTVASDVKGNREVVSTGTGYLCDPVEPKGYAEALKQLVENPMLRKAQGIAATVRAEEHFDGEVTMRRINSIYDELLFGESRPTQIPQAA